MDLAGIRSDQSAFFQSGKTRVLDFRLQSLARLEDAIEQRSEDVLDALASDFGKPRIEAYLSELYFVKLELRHFRRNLRSWAKPQRVGAPFFHFPTRNEIRREPFGCSLVMGPWNYPFQISLAPLISAVAAGNCVILKPSELAPATSRLISEIVGNVFDPAHVTVVEGGPEVSEELTSLPFDFVFFTGSGKVGKLVAKAAAGNLTPTVLELGGKCPVVVDETADLEISANRIVLAKFFNAGQTCFAPDFVAVHESVREDFAGKLAEELEGFYAGDVTGDLARIINSRHYSRLTALLSENDDCFTIGEDDPDSRFMAPRIVNWVDWKSPLMEEEIFGPILPVLGYESEEALFEKLRSLTSPLAVYVFSRDAGFSERISSRIRSGAVGINDIGKQASNLKLPFGGVGGSGMGRYRGRFGFEAFTYQRTICRRWFVKDLFTIQPPYAGKLEKFRKFLK